MISVSRIDVDDNGDIGNRIFNMVHEINTKRHISPEIDRTYLTDKYIANNTSEVDISFLTKTDTGTDKFEASTMMTSASTSAASSTSK